MMMMNSRIQTCARVSLQVKIKLLLQPGRAAYMFFGQNNNTKWHEQPTLMSNTYIQGQVQLGLVRSGQFRFTQDRIGLAWLGLVRLGLVRRGQVQIGWDRFAYLRFSLVGFGQAAWVRFAQVWLGFLATMKLGQKICDYELENLTKPIQI